MPSLTDLAKMKNEVVLAHLITLPTSKYVGMQKEVISRLLTFGKARREMADLILINDWKKANFTLVSDLGSFEASSSRQKQESQSGEEAGKKLASILHSRSIEHQLLTHSPLLKQKMRFVE